MSEISRRNFLKVIGVTGATLAGCSTQPPEKLIPYWVPPEEVIPGKAIWYATTCHECPAGCGMQVRTLEGRAIKVEGNKQHPVNAGGLCARGQAVLQGLYNPDRIRQPLSRNNAGVFLPTSWAKAEERLTKQLSKLIRSGKAGRIVLLTPHLNGSLGLLIKRWMENIGITQHFSYEPFAYEPLQEAAQIVFGEKGLPRYEIEKAELLLSFGADFLETWRSPVAQAKGFAKMRAYHHGHIGKFYYIGPRLSMTASNADRWIMAKPGTELFIALAMIHQILAEELHAPLPEAERKRLIQLVAPYAPAQVSRLTEVAEGTIFRLTHAFATAKPALAFAGDVASSGDNATATAAAVCLLNYVTGNMGKTMHFERENGEKNENNKETKHRYRDMLSLIESMKSGKVEALFVYGVNPVFTLPQAAQFKDALQHVPFVASFSEVLDETTAEVHLVLPDHNVLESWGDYSPEAGVYGLIQPVMRPLYQTKAFGDVLISVAQKLSKALPWKSYYDFLRDRWKAHQARFSPMSDFEDFWQESLKQGGRWQKVRQKTMHLSESLFEMDFKTARFDGDKSGLILYSYPSPAHFDGRGADKSWLQELPDPISKLTWENWIEVHPLTAHKLSLLEGDWVKITSPKGSITLPVHLYEGLRPDTVAIPLGQGHTHLGRYAKDRGANAMTLLPASAEALSGGITFLSVRVQLKATGRNTRLATVSGSDRQGERGIAQAIPLTQLMSSPDHQMKEEETPNIYPEHKHALHRWGMTIDLQSCTGCSACTVACSAENNLPVVGKERVITGHEMSWMRIERYVEGKGDRLFTHFLPMFCQQCDDAPCEPVCPVYATYHNDEGLNVQVYNRCIGVRYCSNNCPYKVRRFNWEASDFPEPLHLQLNPELSVRAKGIMEKCTFCVQRIKGVQDQAKDENRPIRDGEIQPACAQSCPTQAIVFGDLNDPNSTVSKQAKHRRGYHVLEQLNTKPAVNYLKRIRQDAEQV